MKYLLLVFTVSSLFLLASPCYGQVATPVSPRASAPTAATMQNAATANGNGSLLNVNGQAVATLTVNCDSCTGGTTINFEGTADGANFVFVHATQLGSMTIANSTSMAGITVWEITAGGLQSLRARISSYFAGTVTVTGRTHANSAAARMMYTSLRNATTGAEIIPATESGNLQTIATTTKQDDTSFLPTTDFLIMGGFEHDDAAPTALGEGNAGAARISANRNQYIQVRDGAGNERGANVSVGGSLQVTCDNCGGSTFADNAAFTFGTTPISNIGAVVDDVATNSVTENSAGNPRMSPNRVLYGNLRNSSGTEVVTATTTPGASDLGLVTRNIPSGTQAVSGTVTANAGSGDFNVVGTQSDNSTNSAAKMPTIPARANASAPSWTEGNQVPLSVDLSGSQRVAVTNSPTVTVGTFPDNEPINIAQINGVAPLMGNGTTGTGSQRVTIASDNTPFSVNATSSQSTAANLNAEVQGDAAQDAPTSGNPVLIGLRASTVIPSAMSADGDAVSAWANRNGAIVVSTAPHVGLNADPWSLQNKVVQLTASSTGTDIISPTAGKKIVVTGLQIQAGGTTAGNVQVYFGEGTYVRGTNRALFDGEFAPSSTSKPGVVMNGPFIAGAADDNLRVASSANINPLTVSVWYYEL